MLHYLQVSNIGLIIFLSEELLWRGAGYKKLRLEFARNHGLNHPGCRHPFIIFILSGAGEISVR